MHGAPRRGTPHPKPLTPNAQVCACTGRHAEGLDLFRQASTSVPKKEVWVWAHAKFEVGSLFLLSCVDLEPGHRYKP